MPMVVLRRLAFVLVWLLELVLVAGGALLLAAWVWSGTDGSLATALKQAQPYLPQGQSLEVRDVSGSIRGGGRIGQLRWNGDGMEVQAHALRFAWQPLDLLQRRLRFTALEIETLQIDDRRPASEPRPPPEVVLPLELELPFSIGRVRLLQPTAVDVTELAGRYQFADDRHQLQLQSLAVAQGRYAGRLNLQARAPMTLDLQLQGTVAAPIAPDRTVALEASATLRGTLAGTDAHLDLLAQLQPGPGGADAPVQSRAMRASASAQISPWATQPVVRAQSSFNHLDLAALWPAAPRTQLTGNAWLRPVGVGWQVDFNLINRGAGPWDKGQLPLDSAKGLVELADGQWRVQSLQADAAGGRIRLQGILADPAHASADNGWEGQLQLQGINPALLHSQMEPVRLDGTVKARAHDKAVAFDAQLQPSPGQERARALRGLRLRDLSASGRWADGWVRLDTVRLRTAQAVIDGRVDVQIATAMARGQLQLVAPGLQARLSGRLGAREGDGELSVRLTDAGSARRWIAALPLVPAIVDGIDVQGNGDLALRWTGGWDALLHGRGATPSIDAALQLPRLTVRMPNQTADQALRLSDATLTLSGALDALQLSARADASRPDQRLQLQTAAQGGRDGGGNWQATVGSLQLQLQDAQWPGPWKLALAQPLLAAFTPSAGRLLIGSGEANLTGPQPGAATLAWEPLRWQGGTTGALQSKGFVRGLPMAWLALLAKADLSAAGLSGNLVFDGQWDVSMDHRINARASLQRRSGDIRIQADGAASGGGSSNATTTTVEAGIRELQLQLDSDGDRVNARFRWDSERAGNAQATLSTRLARGTDGSWSWTPDSPLQATVRARMPQVGVWSLLAPPGWRVRGTLDADLQLAGSLREPQWSGNLQANEMALRSVIDGIEFGNGQLRATLLGQRLNIERFSLQGAGGASGGELTATGFANWAAPPGSERSALQAIAMQIDARARALRVSARADRRLVVSGTLQGLLDQARLRIRGALVVDQALFILPDETTPRLGADVVVLRAAPPATASAAANGPARTPAAASSEPGGRARWRPTWKWRWTWAATSRSAAAASTPAWLANWHCAAPWHPARHRW